MFRLMSREFTAQRCSVFTVTGWHLSISLRVPGHAGLNALVVKRLVENETDKSAIMGTSLAIKGLGFITGLLLLLGFAFYPGLHTSTERTLLAIMCVSLLIQPGYVLDFWFQAHYEARYQALSKQIALVLVSGMKVGAAAMGASILWIAGATVMQALIAVVFLVLFYRGTATADRQRWRFDGNEAISLLRQGGVVFLGTFFAAIYLKLDQIMLKMVKGDAEVGVYAVAATISEAFYFIPVAITTAVFPRLIELRSENPNTYQHRTQQLLDGLASLALVLAILVTLLATPFISIVFGAQYSGAALILSIHIWAAVFIFMRAVFSKWIVAEGFNLVFSDYARCWCFGQRGLERCSYSIDGRAGCSLGNSSKLCCCLLLRTCILC